MEKKLVVIVDSNNTLYRMFHTQPPLLHSGVRVESAKAAYRNIVGFTRDTPLGKAERVIAVFDAPGKNFRHEANPEYKASRKGMPAELKTQEDILSMGLKASGVSVIVKSGYEADDTIGMIANRYDALGYQVLIVANDKDMMQLVGENIKMYNPVSKKIIDVDGVFAATGVTPKQIPDFLALMGDDADDIIGVDGVGKATAAKWLNLYGSLNGVVENASSIKGVVGANLARIVHCLAGNLNLTVIRSGIELLSEDDINALDYPEGNAYDCSNLSKQTGIDFGLVSYATKSTLIEKVSKQAKPAKVDDAPAQQSMF